MESRSISAWMPHLLALSARLFHPQWRNRSLGAFCWWKACISKSYAFERDEPCTWIEECWTLPPCLHIGHWMSDGAWASPCCSWRFSDFGFRDWHWLSWWLFQDCWCDCWMDSHLCDWPCIQAECVQWSSMLSLCEDTTHGACLGHHTSSPVDSLSPLSWAISSWWCARFFHQGGWCSWRSSPWSHRLSLHLLYGCSIHFVDFVSSLLFIQQMMKRWTFLEKNLIQQEFSWGLHDNGQRWLEWFHHALSIWQGCHPLHLLPNHHPHHPPRLQMSHWWWMGQGWCLCMLALLHVHPMSVQW